MKRILAKSGAILCGLVIGVAIGGWVVSVPDTTEADEGEEIVPLEVLQPMRRADVYVKRAESSLIAGRIWNDVHVWSGYTDAGWRRVVYDTGGSYNLFEAWLGIDDDDRRGSLASVVIVGDGERLGQIDLHRGDGARFFSCSLERCRALELWFRGQTECVVMANPRLVAGRTEPSQPQDIYIDDGEIKYIEEPGEYCFHVR